MASLAAVEIVSAVVAIAGAGVSAYGQYQTGKAQEAIGQINAAQQTKQAQAQLVAAQTQAALTRQQSEANFKLRSYEALAHANNATAIEDQANAQDRVERINLIARRDDFARMQGEQRASIAASGIVESSGTPLDLLAETAGKIQQDQEEQHWSNEVQRRTLFSEADQERLGGQLALAGATLDRDSGVAQAGLRDASARADYLAGVRGADITRLTGSAQQAAAGYSAGATLLSGVSSAAGYGASLYTPKTTPTYKAG